MVNPDVKKFLDNIAAKRDSWKSRNRYYYHYLEDVLFPFLVPPNKKVIQIGCGTGDLLVKVKPSWGLGIDVSPEMIAIAKSKYPIPEVEFKTISAIDFEEKYDYVILSDVLGYSDDIESLFQSFRNLVDEDGRIVITQYNQLWEPVLEFASWLGLRMKWLMPQNWLSRDDIENLLYLAGFEVVHHGRKILLPKYVPLLTLLINRIIANLPLLSGLCLVNYIVARKIPEKAVNQTTVSVIVPARNEAGTIELIARTIPEMGKGTEIIFIEGHSRDQTLKKIEEVVKNISNRKIIYSVQEGKGKGDAVRKGFKMASGDILMIYDADMTVPPDELPKFYDALINRRGEFINGSRLVYPLEKQSMRFLNYIGNKFFSVAFSWLLSQKVKDTLCGTKVLRREDYKNIESNRNFFGDFDPFGDFDLLFGAAKLNLKIVDLPVHYRERKYGQTNIQRFRHGWLLLKMFFFALRKIKFI